MDTQKYNGWTNWATWMVNLHFDCLDFTDEVDDGTFDDISKDDLCRRLAFLIKDYVESYLDEVADTSNTFVGDLINGAMQDVDWHDIADHYVDDILKQLKDREPVAA